MAWPDNVADFPHLFYGQSGFPSVCGCVDGTMINIDSPNEFEENFVNRHGDHALNVLMICGPNYEFVYVNANWPGSVHDARVLRNSNIFRRFENGWRPFPDAVILGDSAYSLKPWLITPVNRNPNDMAEKRFNRAHKKCRRMVENSLGILKEKFPCLNYMRLCPKTAAKVVLACATLHNIARKIHREDVYLNIDTDSEDDDEPEEPDDDEPVPTTNARLERLLFHFVQ